MIVESDILAACTIVEDKIKDELVDYDWDMLLNIGAWILGYDHSDILNLHYVIENWNGDA